MNLVVLLEMPSGRRRREEVSRRSKAFLVGVRCRMPTFILLQLKIFR